MPMTDQRKLLLIQARNLGDAVISTAVVETVGHAFPASSIDVLTRPEIAQIFAHNPHVDTVFTARFPMGSLHDFRWKEAFALPGLVRALRRKGYTDVVNLQGDFREELLGLSITRQRNWSPAWAPGHPGAKVVRESAFPLANSPVPIPLDQPNMHDAAATVGRAVTGAAASRPALYTSSHKKIAWTPLNRAVGLHPMASQPCRRWELEKWAALAGRLVENGFDVHVFGSPSEAAELTRHFGSLDSSKLSLIMGNLENYFATVAKMRVLLCPDSFAAHVAYALGVPAILLNGANDAKAWAPPGTVVLAAGPGMSCYPCYNRPTCVGSDHQYGCVQRIEMESVLKAVWGVLQSTDSPKPADGSVHRQPHAAIYTGVGRARRL